MLDSGVVTSKTTFPSGQEFHYTLASNPASVNITASYFDNEIRVQLPTEMTLAWTKTEQIAIKSEQVIDDGERLSILIEKDFACLAPRTNEDEADMYRGHFSLNKDVYNKYCQDNTVIMHPLPRDSRPEANELDTDLNDLDNLAIFRQAQNGVLVRMALFALTLGVEDQLTQHEKPVNWFTNKNV